MGSWIRRSHFLFLVPFAIKPVPPFLLFFFVGRTCHHFPHGFMCFVSRVHKVRSTLLCYTLGCLALKILITSTLTIHYFLYM